MAFLISPGVEVRERDLTNIIPAVSTSIGGFAGIFEWGPALSPTTVSSEANLLSQFGYPRISTNAGSNTRDDWYSAVNFLQYSNNLQLVRVLPDGARNAASEPFVVTPATGFTVVLTGTPNGTAGYTVAHNGTSTITFTPTNPNDIHSVAASMIDELVVQGATSATLDSDAIAGVDDPTINYNLTSATLPVSQTVNGVTFSFFSNNEIDTDAVTATSAQINDENDFAIEETTLANGSIYARYPGQLGNSLGVILVDAGITDSDFENKELIGKTTLSDYFDDKPGTSVWARDSFDSELLDEVHAIVYTVDTQITGTINEVLEVFPFMSKAKNAKTADGGINYYGDIINTTSKWIYAVNEETFARNAVTTVSSHLAVGTTVTGVSVDRFKAFLTNIAVPGIRSYALDGGLNGSQVSDADYIAAYDKLNDVESVDVSLIVTGRRSKTVQKHVIDICEARKDCISFISPDYTSAVTAPTAAKIVDYFNNAVDGFKSTSYAVFDSGWKRQYDRYNDEYFWSPLNSDTAGVAARTDVNIDAWWSPAGLNRGSIQDVVKLAFNPNQTDRDTLYSKRVNPIVSFRGQGTILYGDKTALSRPSAFDRINVRRLFITLEKAIATAARFQLFEFNDDFTRRSFVNAVEPYLSDIKTRRGLTDYKVVCDESNNTPEVIDSNRFVADIYIKPNRSINFVTLTFSAVKSGVSFSEVVG